MLCVNASISVGNGESAQVHLNVFKPLPGIGHFDISVLFRPEEVHKRVMIKMQLSTSFF